MQYISGLPGEILALIFSCVQGDPKKVSIDLWMKWIVVTHVCRLWRHVALQHPYLFRYIEVAPYYYGHVGEFLCRSRSALLTVNIRLHGGESAGFYDTVSMTIKHMSRFRELYIEIHEKEVDPNRQCDIDTMLHCFRALGSPAPHLKNLHVRLHPHHYISMLGKLDVLDMPSLTSVALKDCWIRTWRSGFLQRLTCLWLKYTSVFNQPTTSELLDVLSACDNLEDILLVGVEPRLGNSIPLQSIDLPHLRSIHVRMTSSAWSTFFRHLNLPGKAVYRLNLSNYPQGNPINVLPRNLLANLHSCASLSITLDEGDNGGMTFGLRALSGNMAQLPIVSVNIMGDSEPDIGLAFDNLATIIQRVVGMDVTTFLVDLSACTRLVDVQSWTRLLSAVSMVHFINLECYRFRAGSWTEHALAHVLMSPDSQGNYPCPNLGRLHLGEVNTDIIGDTFIKSFRECAMRRCEHGLPLLGLEMQDQGQFYNYAGLFKDLFDDARWADFEHEEIWL